MIDPFVRRTGRGDLLPIGDGTAPGSYNVFRTPYQSRARFGTSLQCSSQFVFGGNMWLSHTVRVALRKSRKRRLLFHELKRNRTFPTGRLRNRCKGEDRHHSALSLCAILGPWVV